MTKQKSLKKNFIMNIFLTMSSFIFPLITFPYVSRILLPAGTGKISFATSVISYFSMLSQLGIPMYGVRTCAKVRDDRHELSKTVHEILIVNIVMSIIAYIALFVLIFNVPKLSQEKPLFIIVSLTILFNAIGMEWLYKALEQYTYITIRSLIFKIIAIVAMFLLVHEQKDYVIYGGITIFAASASSVFNFCNAWRFIDIKPMHGYNIKRHLKPIIVFFAMSCATTIYGSLDTVMLGFIKSDIDVGYYNAAVKIKNILVSVVTSLGVVLLPRASYYIEQGLKDEFYRVSKKALHFIFLLAGPLSVYFILFARTGIVFLSGGAYEGAIIPMQIIMPTVLLIGLTNIMGIQMLIPLGKEKIVLVSEIAGAIANLLLNTILIPIFASSGAAVGTLIAELVVFIVQFVSLRKYATKMYRSINYFHILISILLSTIVALFIKYLRFNTFLELMLSAMAFFGMYGMMLLVFKEPLFVEILKQTIGKFLLRIRNKDN